MLLPGVVSVYRITGTGVWSSLDNEAKSLWEYEVAKRLGTVLPGAHGRYQRGRLYGLARALVLINLRNGRFFETAKWSAQALANGISKTPTYLSRKLSELLARIAPF